MEPNRSYIEKADLALADISGTNGLLQPAQAMKFMRLLVKQSKLMGMSTVTPLRSPKQIINKVRFTQRVLRAGQEGVALSAADRTKPTFTNVEHDAQLFKGEIRLTNEILEDNIEGDALRQTIMTVMAEQVASDMDEFLVNSVTSSPDAALAQFDGVLAAATHNVVDVGDSTINKGVFRDMLKTMPSEWLRNKGAMRFLTSVDAEIDYRDSLSDRMTIGGDRALAAFGSEDAVVGYSGIPVMDIPWFPETIGTNSECTDVLLLDPKNVDVGIWRNIRIETDKDISAGVLLVVCSIRFDVLYQEELAVVKATNVKTGS